MTEKDLHRLVASEYYAARYLYAAARVLEKTDDLERRLKLTQNGWGELQNARNMLDSVKTVFESTVPERDKQKLFRDLENSNIFLHTVGPSEMTIDDKDMIYLTRDEVKELMEYLTSGGSCDLCEKTGKDIIRCRKRKAIEAFFVHEIPKTLDGECLWNTYGLMTDDAKENMLNMTWEEAESAAEGGN